MRPPIFADLDLDLDLDAALARAAKEKKLLLVDMTASWCGPCQVMDRTTWVDPKVEAALADRAIVIQVDVDAQQEVAARLRVKAMPTVVAFEDGVERDRVVGLQRSADLLAWLDGLARGETSLQRVRRDAAASPTDVRLRMDLAGRLVQSGELDAATDEYVWLWKHMLDHEPAMYGVRRSFLVAYLQELVGQHPPAHAAFSALRDEVAPGDGALDFEGITDWFALNKVVGETHRILAWFDESRERALATPRLLRALEIDIVPLLVDAHRWADVALLYPDPLDRLRQSAEQRDQMLTHASAIGDAEHEAQLAEFAKRSVRDTAARLVRALRAANRVEDADAVTTEARTLDPSPEMTTALLTASSA